MAFDRLLPSDFKYFSYILHSGSDQGILSSIEEDEAERKALFVLNKLEKFGYAQNYLAFRDALCGSSIFDEHFRAIEQSLFIILILTPTFLQSSWDIYCQNSAFYELMKDGQSYRLLPIAIGLEGNQLPKNLNIKRVLFMNEDSWESDDASWAKLDRALQSGLDYYNSYISTSDCLSISHSLPMQENTDQSNERDSSVGFKQSSDQSNERDWSVGFIKQLFKMVCYMLIKPDQPFLT